VLTRMSSRYFSRTVVPARIYWLLGPTDCSDACIFILFLCHCLSTYVSVSMLWFLKACDGVLLELAPTVSAEAASLPVRCIMTKRRASTSVWKLLTMRVRQVCLLDACDSSESAWSFVGTINYWMPLIDLLCLTRNCS